MERLLQLSPLEIAAMDGEVAKIVLAMVVATIQGRNSDAAPANGGGVRDNGRSPASAPAPYIRASSVSYTCGRHHALADSDNDYVPG